MNKVAGFVGGVILASVLLWWVMPEVDAHKVDKWWEGLSDNQLEDRMEAVTLEELQNFINYTNHEELPENFVYQPHVVNAAGKEQALSAVKQRYPEFVTITEQEYHEAVRANPVRFRAYAHERTSARIFFNLKRAGKLN